MKFRSESQRARVARLGGSEPAQHVHRVELDTVALRGGQLQLGDGVRGDLGPKQRDQGVCTGSLAIFSLWWYRA